jgi:acyl-coenzyme A thioesterase PaaI-like protein
MAGMTASHPFPVTPETALAAYELMFAPWVKQLGLCDFKVDGHKVSARLPLDDALKFVAGAVCGQAVMAAIDTITSMAMVTGDRPTKGTIYQHTHFLRPARDDDFIVEANVLRFGKATAYAECHVRFATSGELVAHAVLEFAF